MERNREARRGTMVAAANGGFAGGPSKRRHRNSSSFRESHEEDVRMEMPETSRLRDRAAKKDRDGKRSSRSKRRRGERMLHGSNRDEEDESSEESMDEDEEDEEDDLSVPVRLPPPSSPPPNPAAASSSPQQNHQHNHHHHPQQTLRKSFPPKVVKWKADETIGVTVPRKARSASTKRSHESRGLGGGGEQIYRQSSMSPSGLSPALSAQISPSSSIGSLRKKMKQIAGAKLRPPKISKSTSLDEIEVAEVLFGMTRQFELPKQDGHKLDARDMDGASGNEAKSRVSSPSSMSLSPAAYPPALPSSNSCSNPSSLPAVAPKRKKPRPMKFDEECPTSPEGLHNLSSLSLPSAGKMDLENQIKTAASWPRSEKNNASLAIKDGGESVDILVSQAGLSDVEQHELVKTEKNKVQDLHQSTAGGSGSSYRVENKEVLISTAKEAAFNDLDVNLHDTPVRKMAPDSPKGEKFKIDLMAPPPGKLSPEGDDLNDFDSDHKAEGPDTEMALKVNNEKKEEKVESTSKMDRQQIEKSVKKDFDLKKQVVFKQNLDQQLDLYKLKKDDIVSDKVQTNKLKVKDPKVEPKQEKSATSLHGPMAVGAWPGSFPPYGYTGQIPSLQAVMPMDGTSCHSTSLQSPALFHMHPRSKRCATHYYIAQMISNHQEFQEFARLSSFWTAATAAAPFFGPKPYNLNIVREAGKPMKGSFVGMNMGSFQDSKGTPVLTAAYTGLTSQEKMPADSSTILEATNQRKQPVQQQIPQSGSTTNMPNGPAFIYPINLQRTAAAANAANRAGAEKSTTGVSADVHPSVVSSSAAGSPAAGGSVTPINLSFASLPPNEAQYLAFLQNSAYPVPVPPHIAGSPPFRGANYAQAMPFFYPSHMLHSTQLRPQHQQAGPLLPHAKQSHQNPSTSSGSSSQKHPQQSQCVGGSSSGGSGTSSHGVPATMQRQDLLPQHALQQECNKGMENNLRNATAAITIGDHGDRQPVYQQAHQQQNMKLELTSPQAFAIPYASFGGVAAAPPGLDFSSMAQNPAIFQSLPEAYRHGYHQMATAAAAAEQKVHQVAADGKPVARELVNANFKGEDDRKIMAVNKSLGNGPQHSFVMRTDNEPPIPSILGNSVVDISSRSLNLVQAPANGSKSTSHSAGTAIATTSVLTTTTNVSYSQQQQQRLIQLQKPQQQQQLRMQHQLASSRSKISASSNNANILPENFPGGSIVSKFPQALKQGSNPTRWSQSKTSAGRASGHAGATPTPAVKNDILQLQGREAQHALPTQNHQIQISFGMNSSKLVPSGAQHLPGACANPPPSSTTIAVGSPSNSASKSAGGSPQASASVKAGLQTSATPIPQQVNIKQSPSSCCPKSLPMSNPSIPSILGHPQRVPALSSNPKQQQQFQLLQQQQPFSQAQLFLSNPHMQQVQCAQASASAKNAAQYYQKGQSEQQTQRQPQQQQQRSALSSTGMLSLCAPSMSTLAGAPTTSDPAKAMATANGMKSLPLPSFLSAAQLAVAAQSASGSPHPSIPATFAYMSLPSLSMKPSPEQKPTAGSDNVHAQQPDKI